MTFPASGAITGANVRDELRQVGGNLVFGDVITRWLADSAGSFTIPTDYYNKAAVKIVDDHSFGGSNSTTWTANYGADYPGRTLIICTMGYRASNSSVQTTGLTVSGVAVPAPIDNRNFQSGSTAVSSSISIAQPTGTSGSVTVTFANVVAGARIVIFSVAGITSANSATGAGNAAVSGLSISTVDVVANGIFFVVVATDNSGAPITFTGATEVVDAAVSAGRMGIAWINRLSAQTDRPASFTILPGSSSCTCTMNVAAFN